MRLYTLFAILLFSLLCFFAIVYIFIYGKENYDQNISCISDHTLTHGSFHMNARYHFSLSNGRGVVRINGKINANGKENAINRQVFFTYIKTGNEYTLTSREIERIGNGEAREAEQHYPSFFSQINRQFSFTVYTDRYDNFVMLFVDIPVFYCIRFDSIYKY